MAHLRCQNARHGGRAEGIMMRRSDGGIDDIRLGVPPCDGCIELSRLAWPFRQAEAAAGLLERGGTQADLPRGVDELEVEEALDSFVADADVARKMSRLRVLYFLRARIKQERSPHLRHGCRSRSAVVRSVPAEERSGQTDAGTR